MVSSGDELSDAQTMAELICEQVSKHFGGIQAVSNVTFTLRDSEITAIIGPNGAGKSTLVNLITGFLRPDTGQMCYGLASLVGRRPYQIARLGISRTFQDLRLIRNMTVIENLRLANPDEVIALACAEKVGIGALSQAYAGDLSYGQQKLLTIACCLASCGDILILDEPVAGVHPGLAEGIKALLKTLQREGKTIVIIEHDLDFVKQVSGRVLVMAEGTIIADGTPAEVLKEEKVVDAYLQ